MTDTKLMWHRSFIFATVMIVMYGIMNRSLTAVLHWRSLVIAVMLILIAFGAQLFWVKRKESQSKINKGTVSKKNFVAKRREFFAMSKTKYLITAIVVVGLLGLYVAMNISLSMGVLMILAGSVLMHVLRSKFTNYLSS